MPDIPKGHKVLDTIKDDKGFYRIVQRPDGTKYRQTLKLFTEQDNQRKINADNKALGQFSVKNIEHNAANAMALTAVGGGTAALALNNLTRGRQDKLGRKVRGAAFGTTKPQGAGLKTTTASAGDVRGRVSPDRPPAIVRSVDSFNKGNSPVPKSGLDKTATVAGNSNAQGLQKLSQTLQESSRGSKMPQTGDLFSQPEAPKTGAKGGTKGGSGAKPAGSGTRARGSAASKSTPPAPSRPTPLNPNGRPTPLNPRGRVQSWPTPRIPGTGDTSQLRPSPMGPPTQSGATSRPTGTDTYSRNPVGRDGKPTLTGTPKYSSISPEFNASRPQRTVVTGNRTVTNPGAALVPSRQSPNARTSTPNPGRGASTHSSGPLGVQNPGAPIQTRQPGGALTRPIPEAKWRVVPPQPKPTGGLIGQANDFLKNLGTRGTGIKRLDTLVQAAAMIDKLGGEPYRQHMAAHPEDRNMTPWQLSEHIRTSKLDAPKAETPAATGGNKPAGGTSQKPSGPAYFPEAARNGSAVRTPDSYLGEAFDYSLQKGTTSGSKYLEHMFRRDKISEDDQQRLRERFNKKVVGDQTLKTYGADKGITENVEGKTPGLGKELLNQYRANNPGNKLQDYRGNTDYGKMRSAAEARLAASKK